MSTAPTIIIVNLFRDHARRLSISSQLEHLGLRYEFWDAVSKDNLTEAHYAQYNDNAVRARVNRSLTPGEIACAFSHAEVWQEIVRRELEYAIVLEDDAILEPGFLDVVQNLDRFPIDWELLNFCSRGQFERTEARITSGVTAVRFIERMSGTVGYCGTGAAFRKVLDHVFPLKAAADGLLSSLVKIGKLRSYGTQPQIIATTDGLKSAIGTRRPGAG